MRESRCAAYIVLNRARLGLSNERNRMATSEARDGGGCTCVLAEIGRVPRNRDQLVRFRNSRWAPHIYINSSEWTSPRTRTGHVQWTASHKSFERFRVANDGAWCHESKKRATPTYV